MKTITMTTIFEQQIFCTTATMTTAADSLAISTDLYDVSKDRVELSMSEALEHKLNPAVDTADIFTGVLQLCNHLPHLQPRSD